MLHRELCAHEGRLAQYRGERLLAAEPIRESYYAVARSLRAEEYSDLIGQVPVGTSEWGGLVTLRGGATGRVVVDSTWEMVTVRAAVPKPRDGRQHTWEWAEMLRGPGWRKVHYPVCRDCGRVHRPGRDCD
jgi:hypothetical protein